MNAFPYNSINQSGKTASHMMHYAYYCSPIKKKKHFHIHVIVFTFVQLVLIWIFCIQTNKNGSKWFFTHLYNSIESFSCNHQHLWYLLSYHQIIWFGIRITSANLTQSKKKNEQNVHWVYQKWVWIETDRWKKWYNGLGWKVLERNTSNISNMWLMHISCSEACFCALKYEIYEMCHKMTQHPPPLPLPSLFMDVCSHWKQKKTKQKCTNKCGENRQRSVTIHSCCMCYGAASIVLSIWLWKCACNRYMFPQVSFRSTHTHSIEMQLVQWIIWFGEQKKNSTNL